MTLDERARPRAAPPDWDSDSDGPEADDQAFKALSRDEAQALLARQPGLSPWRIVAAQAVAGLVMVVLWWLLAAERSKAWSALYGAAAVVVPNVLAAWGTTRRPVSHAGAALLSMLVWESIKILLVIAILVAVIKWVPDLSWPALLLTMVGCLKVYWLALLRWGRSKQSISDGN